MVQDHDYVLGLWPDGRDIDGPRRKEKGLNRAVNTTDVWAHWCVCVCVFFWGMVQVGVSSDWKEVDGKGQQCELLTLKMREYTL